MSIILKGIDLPKKGETIYVILREDEVKCQRWEDIDDEYETPAENLHTEAIQIPKGHGRLIDADKIDYDEFWHRDGHGFTMRVCQKAEQIIEEQPTILEAEE